PRFLLPAKTSYPVAVSLNLNLAIVTFISLVWWKKTYRRTDPHPQRTALQGIGTSETLTIRGGGTAKLRS
ncbi:MAG: hypothetical protein KDA99_15990, partial [Planctomycetales bacterium]|nr:hypothetical protein [Planctomycetales bacterium]